MSLEEGTPMPVGGISVNLMVNEREVLRRTGKQAIREFLTRHTLYDMMRESSKVVFFDTNIPIQLAFYALLEHDISAAPLWDSITRQFVGLLSVTDFIDIIRQCHRRGIPMDELSARTIAEVMADVECRKFQHASFRSTDVEMPIINGVDILQQHKHRYLPLVPRDESRVVSIASYYDMLRYLVSHFREQRRLFEDTIGDLGIGTYGKDVLMVPLNARLNDVQDAMEARNVSAVPVVDEGERAVAIYQRSDITFLATATDAGSVIQNLNLTMQQILQQRSSEDSPPDQLHTCSVRATLQSIFERFAETGFHQLICVDDDSRCVGIVTPRDLISYFYRD